jgi:pimeloyl-ACP methyl ester carboxylesterase
MMRLALALIGLAVTVSSATACEPHIIVLPGIEGPSPCARGIISGIRQNHPNATFEIFDWTTGHACLMLYHASAWKRNQQVACSLASHIVALQTERPDRPIVVVGHSGGGGLVVIALEQLPPGCRVQQAILLAPDIGPNHVLTTALDRTVDGIDVFTSSMDVFVLGMGTVAVGTIDRARAPAAGMIGFSTPKNSDEGTQLLYASKLHQHSYEAGMIRTGHYGGHFTCTLPEFVSRYVSPTIH